MEIIKEIIRVFLFSGYLLFGIEELEATKGTLKYSVLVWLYGEGEEVGDGWVYPEVSNASESD